MRRHAPCSRARSNAQAAIPKATVAAPTRWLLQTTVEAWAGDSYVTTKQGGRTCVRDNIATTSPAGRVKLGAALTAWARGHAGASVTVTGKTSLLLVSCAGS